MAHVIAPSHLGQGLSGSRRGVIDFPEARWPRRDRKWTDRVFAEPVNLVVIPEPEFESENALGLLQAIYNSRGYRFRSE